MGFLLINSEQLHVPVATMLSVRIASDHPEPDFLLDSNAVDNSHELLFPLADVVEAVVLGLLQGTLEWLPVSSQGIVAAVYTLVFGGHADDAVSYSLWLHAGTVPSALLAFRAEVAHVLRELVTRPANVASQVPVADRPQGLTAFLVAATVASAVAGLPLVLFLDDLSEQAGSATMIVVGAALLVTGALQLRRPSSGERARDDLDLRDSLLAGVAQGLSVIPGLSRSGLTVASLLWRGLDRREALVASFLMSVPASLGAALLVGLRGDVAFTAESTVAAAVAFIAGLATIRALIAVAERVNFGAFVLLVGAAVIAGAAWQAAG